MFYNADLKHVAMFNSDSSCKLLSTLNDAIDRRVSEQAMQPHKQAFAPSSAFCDRKTWFRLRGVNPDTPVSTDYYSEFVKMIGDACHVYIQSLLKDALKEDWLDVTEFLSGINPPYEYTTAVDGYETHVEIANPPIRFTVDGLLVHKGKLYILEIKSVEHNTFDELYEPRAKDVCQTQSYQSLMLVRDVMYIYVDRLYGKFKCFEYHNEDTSYESIVNKCNELLRMAEFKIAPAKCTIPNVCNMCEYKQRCKEW